MLIPNGYLRASILFLPYSYSQRVIQPRYSDIYDDGRQEMFVFEPSVQGSSHIFKVGSAVGAVYDATLWRRNVGMPR